MHENDDSLEKPAVINYSVTMDGQLYKRLERHLDILKHAENVGLTRQKWVTDAVLEKIAKEESQNYSEIPKANFLMVRFLKTISDKISNLVDKQKPFKRNFNKKQWILEAIQEKLEQEEPKTKKFLEKLSNKNND